MRFFRKHFVLSIRVLFRIPFLLSLYCAGVPESPSGSEKPPEIQSNIVDTIETRIGKFFGKEEDPEIVKVLIGGDVMFNWGIRDTIKAKGELAPVKGLKSVFESADLRILNLETPVVSEKSWDHGKAYVFQAKESDLESMSFLGVDLVSLGNNHAMDHGPEGLEETLKFLGERKIASIGAGKNLEFAFRPWIWEGKDTNLRIYSATNVAEGRSHYAGQSPGVMPLDPELILKKFQLEKSQPNSVRNGSKNSKGDKKSKPVSPGKQFRILSLHWGVEYSPFPTIEQRKIAKTLADGGLDIIVGHHPHIPQGIEKIGNTIVFYSLGNLIFGSRNAYLNHNLIVILHIKRNKLINIELVPIFGKFQNEDHLVRPLEGKEAQDFLKEIAVLSQDLGTRVRIEEDRGWVELD
ncbi:MULTISPECIES: CapA family protein [unclassified Leptospira]|uniref:CapA family protein n=1 Tax=unclassified Leptospira TaxID=2633828 RepID=UPI0002C01323|nr:MULTISPECIES: CapA family protein [unclassified Leptospira]EMJ98607.1 bacterial capsule synthesis protein [Leptospira sp. B5-022]MCR1792747.1 CapA family protein [Leptospira sp. id769339]